MRRLHVAPKGNKADLNDYFGDLWVIVRRSYFYGLCPFIVFVPFVYLQGELRVYYVPLAIVVALTLLAAVALSLIAVGAGAQTYLDLEGQIQEFTLDNGVRFIVLENHDVPVFSFRTFVNVGSADEVRGVTGLSHILEHMAFNGTAHFQKQELVDYLESVGMQFGPSINAYTSFDETVYMLTVPTDSVEIVDESNVTGNTATATGASVQAVTTSIYDEDEPRTVVGIVDDFQLNGVSRAHRQPVVFVPRDQWTRLEMTFMVRTAGDPSDLIPVVRQAFAELAELTPHSSQHAPGKEVREKHWLYRFAKKDAKFLTENPKKKDEPPEKDD